MTDGAVIDLLHVGYGKTATTTLQRGLFARHPDIRYLGKRAYQSHGPYEDRQTKLLIDQLLRYDEIYYEPDALRDHLLRDGTIRTHPRTVLSEERFTGFLSVGRGIVARRLHEAFPDARILFTIRNQRDAVKAWYAQVGRMLVMAPKPYELKHVTFENWLEHSKRVYPAGVFGALDYWTAIDGYCSLFGEDRVHVLLFEDFVQERSTFVDALGKILDLDPETCDPYLEGVHDKPRHKERLLRYQVVREKLLPGVPLEKLVPGGKQVRDRLMRALSEGPGVAPELSERWDAEIEARCASGNARLAERFELPLVRYGYPLPSTGNPDPASTHRSGPASVR